MSPQKASSAVGLIIQCGKNFLENGIHVIQSEYVPIVNEALDAKDSCTINRFTFILHISNNNYFRVLIKDQLEYFCVCTFLQVLI